MPENNPLPGWYQDPSGFGEGRYWNGMVWTDSVSRAGTTVEVPMEAARAALPPIPGSEIRAPAPIIATPYVAAPEPKQSSAGIIVGVIGAVLLAVLLVVLLTNDGDSSNDTPPTDNPPATEAPVAPATEAPAAPDTTG